MDKNDVIRALAPFAAFADMRGALPDQFVITEGSPLAKKQLTMGDCRKAYAVWEQLQKEKS